MALQDLPTIVSDDILEEFDGCDGPTGLQGVCYRLEHGRASWKDLWAPRCLAALVIDRGEAQGGDAAICLHF